jgi:thiosulfate reductase cytochrome b subunit
MKIAPKHSEAVGQGTRISVEKRFFLDGVALHPADVSPRDVQGSTAIVTNLANPRLTLWNWTAVAAGITTHTIAIELFVKLALTHVFVNDVTQGRQRRLPLSGYSKSFELEIHNRGYGEELGVPLIS